MKSKGFTLIELLVVVAIIGILATVVLSALGDARSRARDARRDSDIKSMQTALEIYYLENGQYPNQTTWLGVAPSSSYANSGNASWITLETMMGVTLPRDPINFTPVVGGDWAAGANKQFNYAYIARAFPGCQDGQAYLITYRRERGDTPAAESPGVRFCTGALHKSGNGSVTVGMSPAQ